MSTFQIAGLSASRFSHFRELSDTELAASNIRRVMADASPGYPCRVGLDDAAVGEEMFLLSYEHHRVDSPYLASGPIYVRVHPQQQAVAADEVPSFLATRLISLRAYGCENCMVAATACTGDKVNEALTELFLRSDVQYVQIHNAKYGCFLCEATRPEKTA